MSEKILREFRNNKNGFDILTPEKAPDGLEFKLLWKIWCMCLAYGSKRATHRAVIYRDGILFFAISANISQKITRPALFVSKAKEEDINSENHFVFKLVNGVLVFWHRSFSASYINDVIAEVEENIKKAYLINAFKIAKRLC